MSATGKPLAHRSKPPEKAVRALVSHHHALLHLLAWDGSKGAEYWAFHRLHSSCKQHRAGAKSSVGGFVLQMRSIQGVAMTI